MKKPLLAAMSLVLLVSACGSLKQSRLNPMNWFGRSEAVATTPEPVVRAPQDARDLVAQVVSMAVEPATGGAIVRATGLPPTQGYWQGELVAQPLSDNGVQTFDFRVFPPVIDMPSSTQRSREVTVATYLSNTQLAKISQIVVQGASNARSSRR